MALFWRQMALEYPQTPAGGGWYAVPPRLKRRYLPLIMGSVATRKDWTRLAEAARDRRNELGLTQEDVTAAGGPSTSTMRLIEGALQDGYTPVILRRLETALRWAPGSARALLTAGDPVPLPGESRLPSPPVLSGGAVFPAPAVTAAARRAPAAAPAGVRAHLYAALAAVNAPLRERVLAEAASGRPFTDLVEKAIWESPEWTPEEKAEEIAAIRARRAEFGQATGG